MNKTEWKESYRFARKTSRFGWDSSWVACNEAGHGVAWKLRENWMRIDRMEYRVIRRNDPEDNILKVKYDLGWMSIRGRRPSLPL